MRLALVSVALAIVAGCASEPPAPKPADPAQVAQADPNERKQVCVREQPIGSAIPATRCHYEDTGVAKAMELDAFRTLVNQNTRPRVPGSGN